MLSMNSTLIREAPVIRSQKRVSDLVLPPMPSAPDEMLPVPSGINEWACLQVARWTALRTFRHAAFEALPRSRRINGTSSLHNRSPEGSCRSACVAVPDAPAFQLWQDAVNHISKEKFQTHNAQLGWRKWAMMYTNANVMVDLFWWLAATFFCKVQPRRTPSLPLP